jgi:hypothetical protein
MQCNTHVGFLNVVDITSATQPHCKAANHLSIPVVAHMSHLHLCKDAFLCLKVLLTMVVNCCWSDTVRDKGMADLTEALP